MSKVKLIKTDQDNELALARIEYLLLKNLTPQQSDELDLLVYLVEGYEQEAFPMDLPSPVDAIKFKMDQLDLKQKDLIPYLGSKSKVSEVLSGKRPLTLAMIRSLYAGLKIPYEVLLQEPNAELLNDSESISNKNSNHYVSEVLA